MMLSLLMLAQATTAAPPPAAQGHPVPIFSGEDYPREAAEENWHGTARADLTISPDGQVTACKIVQSTRHKLLDDYTCKMLMTRARFTPARDKDGNPIESHFITPPITYAIRN